MTNMLWVAQKAVFEALEAALALSNVPVFDHVPADQAYPYVSIDRQNTSRADYFDGEAANHFFYLSVWSDHRGMKQVTDILTTIETALHRKKLSLFSGEAVALKVTSVNCSKDADGLTYMGSAAISFLIDYHKD
jgi:hypothetical protein